MKNIQGQLSDNSCRYLCSKVGERLAWTDEQEDGTAFTAHEAEMIVDELTEIYAASDILISAIDPTYRSYDNEYPCPA